MARPGLPEPRHNALTGEHRVLLRASMPPDDHSTGVPPAGRRRCTRSSCLWRENSLRTSYRVVLEHIRANNRHGLRIEELARLVGTTPEALRKGFRRTMGVPLKTYLRNDLLHRALQLLLGTEMNITQIAARLGYENPFYFERAFKRVLRDPPLRYRKKSREWIHFTAAAQPGRMRAQRD